MSVPRLLAWAQEALGYSFQEARWLEQALTHPTSAYEAGGGVVSNQRLEFLGDAVVSLVVTRHLFESFTSWAEGDLTKVRAAVVAAPTLARRARELGVGPVLRLGRGEEQMGGSGRESNLADAFEALVAAIYLDGGIEPARAFVLRELAGEVEAARQGRLHPNYKAQLLEWSQREYGTPPVYQVVAEAGPVHARRYTVEVLLMGRPAGCGEGNSKRAAEQEAARAALARQPARDGHARKSPGD